MGDVRDKAMDEAKYPGNVAAREMTVREFLDREIADLQKRAAALALLADSLPQNYLGGGASMIAGVIGPHR